MRVSIHMGNAAVCKFAELTGIYSVLVRDGLFTSCTAGWKPDRWKPMLEVNRVGAIIQLIPLLAVGERVTPFSQEMTFEAAV